MRRPLTLLASSAAAVAVAAGASPGLAKSGGGDDEIRRAGSCSGASTAKLKAKLDDGRIETELEVDQNRNGVRWNVTLRRNGKTVARVSRVTRPPSGSFEVERRIANPAGTDRISALARRDGETCRASVSS